jgi:preprotein translocase subunit SecA
MRIFMGQWVKPFLERLGMQEGDRIESRMVSRRIEGAQKKREEHNFDIRKNLLEYDEVMDEQRKRVYGFRQRILDGENCRDVVLEMLEKEIKRHVDLFMQRDFGVDTFAKWAGSKLGVQFEGRDFRGMNSDEADVFARDEAERQAETQIQDAIDENLPGADDEEGDWNWESLTNICNRRWGTNFKDRDLKKVGKQDMAEFLHDQARKFIQGVDLSEGYPFLDEKFRFRSLAGWFAYKFGVELQVDELATLEAAPLAQKLMHEAVAAYEQKEAAYPVMAGMYRFTTKHGKNTEGQIDGNALVAWAEKRFEASVSVDELHGKNGDEIFDVLIKLSQQAQQRAQTALGEMKSKVQRLFQDVPAGQVASSTAPSVNGVLDGISTWLASLQLTMTSEELGRYHETDMQRKLSDMIEDRFRPEMRLMERQVLLEIVDSSWKDHLLVMDRLRSSIGLVGYAQLDAKVEYKREGMRLFEEMWKAVGEKATDLVLKIEQLNEEFVSSTWQSETAIHAEAPSTSDMARQQQDAIDNSNGEVKVETIRNRGQRVGRNDPCPCNSGRKYKHCCMRKQDVA